MKFHFDILKKSQRITRTIIGMPSSCDITSYIGPDEDWGSVDNWDKEIITFEDVDDGIVYFKDGDKFYKIKSLIDMGFSGLDGIDSLHDIITIDNLI